MQLVIPCRTCENRTVIRLCKCVVVLLMFCTMYTAVPPFVEYRFEKKYTHSIGNHRASLVLVQGLHSGDPRRKDIKRSLLNSCLLYYSSICWRSSRHLRLHAPWSLRTSEEIRAAAAAELPSCRAAELPSCRAAEPPSCRAAELTSDQPRQQLIPASLILLCFLALILALFCMCRCRANSVLMPC